MRVVEEGRNNVERSTFGKVAEVGMFVCPVKSVLQKMRILV